MAQYAGLMGVICGSMRNEMVHKRLTVIGAVNQTGYDDQPEQQTQVDAGFVTGSVDHWVCWCLLNYP